MSTFHRETGRRTADVAINRIQFSHGLVGKYKEIIASSTETVSKTNMEHFELIRKYKNGQHQFSQTCHYLVGPIQLDSTSASVTVQGNLHRKVAVKDKIA